MTVETQSAVAAISKPADVGGEPDMEAYAAQRMGSTKNVAKTADATETDEAAAATESNETAAAATVETDDGSKTTPESATDDDVISKLEEEHPAKKDIKESFSKMSAKQKEIQAQADAAKAEAEQARREAAEAKAEADRLKAEAEQLAKTAIPVVKPAAEDTLPARADFDDPDEYTAALSAHAARAAIRESAEAAQAQVRQRAEEAQKAADTAKQEQAQAQIVALHKSFNERLEKAKSEIPDFEAKVFAEDTPQLDIPVFAAVEHSELGPHILYHLAENPSEAENLNKLHRTNPVAALMRLGALEVEIRIANKPKPTKAAAPVKPIGSRANPERKTPDEMSVEEYEAAYQARQAAQYAKSHPGRLRR